MSTLPDKKSFIGRVAARAGVDSRTASRLTDTLATLIGGSLAEGDSVAIPGFGEFSPSKTDEYISTSPSGSRVLNPPSLNPVFTPGTSLRNKLKP